MKWGIIAALEEELQPLLKELQLERQQKVYGTTVYQGTIYGQPVVLCKCGIATVNAALCTSVVIREFGADRIINTGIAGALGDGVKTLDVVISEDVCYHNRDNALERYYPFTNCFAADPELIECIRQAAEGLVVREMPVCARVGRIVTGDLFIEDSAIKKDLCARYHPLCVEMEGAAIANTAFANGCPFAVVRTMSDCADENAAESYDDLIERASEISAQIVLRTLKNAG